MSLTVSVIVVAARLSARVLPGALRHEAEVRPPPRPDRAVPDELPPARARLEGDPRRTGCSTACSSGPGSGRPTTRSRSSSTASSRSCSCSATSGCRSSRSRSSSRSRASTGACSRRRATSAQAACRRSARSRCRSPRRASCAAFMFVFIPTVGEFVTPSLVGGVTGYMYGNQIVDLFGTGLRLADRLGALALPALRRRGADARLLPVPAAAAGDDGLMDVALSKNGRAAPAGLLRPRRRLPLRADPDPADLLVQRLGSAHVPAQRLHARLVPPVPHDSDLHTALRTSAIVAALSSLGAVALGILASLALPGGGSAAWPRSRRCS